LNPSARKAGSSVSKSGGVASASATAAGGASTVSVAVALSAASNGEPATPSRLMRNSGSDAVALATSG
jgi:hypothetical protein